KRGVQHFVAGDFFRCWNLKHSYEDYGLACALKAPCSQFELPRLFNETIVYFFEKVKFEAITQEQLDILLGQSVLRLCQNIQQCFLIQRVEVRQHRKTADKLRN